MNFQKTNVPGYLKDKKTNILQPVNLEDKVRQVVISRQKFREYQQLIRDVKDLKDRIAILESRVR